MLYRALVEIMSLMEYMMLTAGVGAYVRVLCSEKKEGEI